MAPSQTQLHFFKVLLSLFFPIYNVSFFDYSSPSRLFWQLKFRIWSQKESNALGSGRTTTQIETTTIVSTTNATLLGTPLSASTVLLQAGFEDIELPANHPSRIFGFLATAAAATTTTATANGGHVPHSRLQWSCGGVHQVLATRTPTALLPHAPHPHDDGGRQGCPTPLLPGLRSMCTYGQVSASEQGEHLRYHEVSLNADSCLFYSQSILFSPCFFKEKYSRPFFTLFVTPFWYDWMVWWYTPLLSSSPSQMMNIRVD